MELYLLYLYCIMGWLGERDAIVAKLRRALKAGDKALVGNAGYCRFEVHEPSFAIDQTRGAEDPRLR